MHTPAEIAAQCVTHLKAAKAKAKLAGVDMPWSEVSAIIEAAVTPKPASPAPDAMATVEGIYAIYPRKVGPRAAKTAIERAAARLKHREPNVLAYLLERTRLFSTAVALWPADERQFCPHPSTWFNQGRFDDDTKEWVRGAGKATAPKDYSKL